MKFDTTYLAIDLDAIDHNLAAIRQKAGCKVMAVIKANAYGHGAVPIARHLDGKADFFGVATICEAIELHRTGIQTPILILGHTPRQAYPALIAHGIRPTVFRLDDAQALSAEAVRLGVTVPFHFAVDTGMSRIGFQADEEGVKLCAQVAALPGLQAEGIFSHYATSDEADLTRAEAQHQRFARFLKMLELPIPLIHMSNSAGVMNFSHHHAMVRGGIVLYGGYPSSEVAPEKLPILPVLSWHSHITQLKTLPAGREVGYGGTYTTTAPTRIATVPVGYADGYRRSLSNQFHVLIRGRKAPILGRVCMDQLMVDVTGIPDAMEDDPVVLIGTSGSETITLEQISQAAGVINYEFVCSLHQRMPRYYLQNGQTVDTLRYLPFE